MSDRSGGAYDTFISYSHAADGQLAPALQAGLRRLARPWYRRRALNVFRDQTGLAVTPDLWESIESALRSSEWFVLLASPAAAASPWVNREIDRWCDTKSVDRVLPVLTEGELVWDERSCDYDAEKSTALPPALRTRYTSEPLHLDLRWAHGDEDLDLRHSRFRNAVADLAAPLHGVAKDDLEGEDVRQHKRTVRIARAAAAGLTGLLVVAVLATALALVHRARAEREAGSAHAGRLAATALARADDQLDVALLLAVEAHRREQSPATEAALLSVLATSPYLVELDHLPEKVDNVQLSNSGDVLLTSTSDGVLELRTVRQGRVQLRSHAALGGLISAIALSADGSVVAAIDGGTRSVTTWGSNLEQRAPSATVTGDVVAVSADGSRIATSSAGAGLQVLSSKPGATPMHIDLVAEDALAFSPDGRFLAAGSAPGRVAVIDVATGRIVAETRAGREGPTALAFSPDGSTLIVGNAAGLVFAYDVERRRVIGDAISAHQDDVLAVVIAPDSRTFATASRDGTVRLWDAGSRAAIGRPLVGHARPPSSIAFMPDGQLVSASESEVARWDLQAAAFANIHRLGDVTAGVQPRSLPVATIPGTRQAALPGSGAGTVQIVDVDSGRPVADQLDTGSLMILDVATAGDGNLLAASVADAVDPSAARLVYSEGRLIIWDLATRRRRLEIELPEPAASASFSPDGRSLVSAAADGLTRWSTSSGRALEVVQGRASLVAHVPDGAVLSVRDRGVVELWTGDLSRRLADTTTRTSEPSLAISPDGSLVAVSDGSTIRILDGESLAPVGAALRSAAADRSDLAFSPDGRLLILAGPDGIELWDVAARHQLVEALGAHPAEHAVFVDNTLVVTDPAGTLATWDLSPSAWERYACALARRELTKDEWAEFVGGSKRPICEH